METNGFVSAYACSIDRSLQDGPKPAMGGDQVFLPIHSCSGVDDFSFRFLRLSSLRIKQKLSS